MSDALINLLLEVGVLPTALQQAYIHNQQEAIA